MLEQPRRKRDKEASKETLLRAAVDLFSRLGYDAATTKAIAAEAGLNEQLITRYFGGKVGLLAAALAAFVDEDLKNDSYPAGDGVEAEIRSFLLHRHRRLDELQDFFRTFLPLALHDGPVRDSVRPILLRETTLLRERLTALKARHLLRADVHIDKVSRMISALSFHTSFISRVSTDLAEAELQDLLTESAAILARGLAP